MATAAMVAGVVGCGGGDSPSADGAIDRDGAAGIDAALACGVLGGACCDDAPVCDGELECIALRCGCADAVASRGQHTCARRTDGSLWCWGRNHHGQLGNDSASDWAVPVLSKLPPGAAVLSFDTGIAHTCAFTDGGLFCWGYNGDGAVGDATTEDRDVPAQIPVPGGGPPSAMLDIALGGFHSCALAAGGTMWCWGDNEAGQIGNGQQGPGVHQLDPAQVPAISGAVAVAAGEEHTCALLAGGTVFCWGLNASGQLGDGTAASRPEPALVRVDGGAALTGIVGIGAGAYHTCAFESDGTMWCWGQNDYGQLGIGTSGPARLRPVEAQIDDVVAVAAGERHTCARSQDGSLRCWGANASGQLGIGSNESYASPRLVDALSVAVDVAAGDIHSCAVADGAVFCWGYNEHGQLGAGEIPSTDSPVKARLTCP